ncbi:MAG: TlpA disulfide reductase family protein, partial [Candidatus Acidiferrales bacterium]
LLIAGLALLSAGIPLYMASGSTSEPLPKLVGKAAPAFTVKTLDGHTISLAGYRGKALLVNFWATWCGECLLEMPRLAQLRQEYAGQGFEVLGVLTDDASPEKVRTILRKNGVSYPIALCNHATARKYGGLPYLPVSFYIGRDGKVVDEAAGAASKAEIESKIRETLAASEFHR